MKVTHGSFTANLQQSRGEILITVTGKIKNIDPGVLVAAAHKAGISTCIGNSYNDRLTLSCHSEKEVTEAQLTSLLVQLANPGK